MSMFVVLAIALVVLSFHYLFDGYQIKWELESEEMEDEEGESKADPCILYFLMFMSWFFLILLVLFVYLNESKFWFTNLSLFTLFVYSILLVAKEKRRLEVYGWSPWRRTMQGIKRVLNFQPPW